MKTNPKTEVKIFVAACVVILAAWLILRNNGQQISPAPVSAPSIVSQASTSRKTVMLPEPKTRALVSAIDAPPAVPKPPEQALQRPVSRSVTGELAKQFKQTSGDDLVSKVLPGIITATNDRLREKGAVKPNAAMLADEIADVGFVASRIAANEAFEATALKKGPAVGMEQALEYYRDNPQKNGSPVIRMAQVWDAQDHAGFTAWYNGYDKADQADVERLIFKGLAMSPNLDIKDYPATHPQYAAIVNGWAVTHAAKHPEEVKRLAMAPTTDPAIRDQLLSILSLPKQQ